MRAPFLDFLLHSLSYLLLAHTHHPYVTDIDLKKTAKFFAQKFATGASVTKNPQGHDEIVVQGDVSGDIVEMIEDGVGPLSRTVALAKYDHNLHTDCNALQYEDKCCSMRL